MKRFNDVIDANLQKLETYSPIVARVHGKEHPEFLELKKVIDVLVGKLKDKNFDLDEEFKDADKITNYYEIPSGVCETYIEVYSMIKELHETYEESKK